MKHLIKLMVAPILTGLATLVIWWCWSNIGELRGTILWEYRWLVLGCGAILFLSIVESLITRVVRLL